MFLWLTRHSEETNWRNNGPQRNGNFLQESHAGRRKTPRRDYKLIFKKHFKIILLSSQITLQEETEAQTRTGQGWADHTLTRTVWISRSLGLYLNFNLTSGSWRWTRVGVGGWRLGGREWRSMDLFVLLPAVTKLDKSSFLLSTAHLTSKNKKQMQRTHFFFDKMCGGNGDCIWQSLLSQNNQAESENTLPGLWEKTCSKLLKGILNS